MGEKISQLIAMLDQLPEAQAKSLIKRLFKQNPVVAVQVITRQFGFGDLIYASPEGLKALRERTTDETLQCALNGSPEGLVKGFTKHMKPDEAMRFIDGLYQRRVTDQQIKSAQQKVLVQAFLLHRKGRLKLSRPRLD